MGKSYFHYLNLLLLSLISILFLTELACKAPAPSPTLPPPAFTPTPAATIQTPYPTTTPTPGFADPAYDLFDKAGNPITAEPYIDIMGIELYKVDKDYIARIKVNSPLPSRLEGQTQLLEWDILIDTDRNAGTGWNWPLVCNDIGPDYYIHVGLADAGYYGQLQEIKTRKMTKVNYLVKENAVELSFSPETIGFVSSFDYVVAVRKYGQKGNPDTLIAADKAPNQGHYKFPATP